MMNPVLSFLNERFEQLNLGRYGKAGSFSTLMLTPNIHRASHVEFLIMAPNQPNPIFVAKVPRTPESYTLLQKEHDNLQAIQNRNSSNAPEVPRIIAFEQYQDLTLLLETPITGTAIGPRTDRLALEACWQQITSWQIELQQFQQIQRSIALPETARVGWFQRLVEYPIRYITKYFPITDREVRLLVRTWDLVQPLNHIPLPLVFEHKSLEKYNVKLMSGHRVGIVQWDMADHYGLPACDLFRLFGTAALSIDGATSRSAYSNAIQRAFFEREGWARTYIEQYARALQLSDSILTALFALTWIQAIMNQMIRLGHAPVALDSIPHTHNLECTPATAKWLRKRPSYLLWEHTIEHASQLYW